ncbi:MAG: HD-like signal output (HDOD) protein [Methylophagaceae bacterium]|jgi:HD-like signal output (HDOD) protein
MKLEIQPLFNQIDNIPQIPEIVRILISQANDPNIDFKAIAINVEKEQAVSVKVLRLVNSSHYGLSSKIGSIQHALVFLGMNELKKLIVVSGLVSSIHEIPGFNLYDFWNDNFRTATYAKWLADDANLNSSEVIFTAGLISSLGKVLIHLDDATNASKINSEVRAGIARPDSERKHLGFTHQEVGAELCRIWQFSNELIDTISKAGEPLNFDNISLAACTLYIARYISESSYSNKEQQTILADFPYKEWQQLGLKEEDVAEKMAILLALDTGLEGVLD